jgi:hypothetical protein
VQDFSGYYAQSHEEGAESRTRQGCQEEASGRYCNANGDVAHPLEHRPAAAGLLAATIAVPEPATGRAVLGETTPLLHRIV